jgi:lactoylglutathione lyase
MRSTMKEEVATLIRRVVATELIVRDLAKCTAFYRDTLGLEMKESDSESSVFKIGDVYFFVMGASAASDLISEGTLELKIEGGPRSLLAVEVEDVDTAYETLKARGVTFLRLATDQPWGLRTAHFVDPEGNPWEIHQSIESRTEK